MKNLLTLLGGLLLVCGCSQLPDQATLKVDSPGDLYTVSFTLAATTELDILHESRDAEGEILYNIMVYDSDFTTDNTTYWGLFSDLDQAVVQLYQNRSYHIVVHAHRNFESGFGFGPFYVDDHREVETGQINTSPEVLNRFYKEKVYVTPLFPGFIIDNVQNKTLRWPNKYGGYFGTRTFIQPTENMSIELELQKCIYGLNIEVDNLSEGIVYGQFHSTSEPELYLSQQENYGYGEYVVSVPVRMFSHVHGDNTYELDEEEITFYWKKNDGTVVELLDEPVRFTPERLKTTTIRITIPGEYAGCGMNFRLEDDKPLMAGQVLDLTARR